ncbi:hypothetical protein Y1Q_0010814 [Alligator mississippiensis]|uniref:Uncharacterized protein n=1 Tax=Alligator mississippiensis TaxID=8496 RepID=A0A151M6W4_ALLMI|nr:hypothetical protein Y1Q_0010814 [Alligator mississippiensis]
MAIAEASVLNTYLPLQIDGDKIYEASYKTESEGGISLKIEIKQSEAFSEVPGKDKILLTWLQCSLEEMAVSTQKQYKDYEKFAEKTKDFSETLARVILSEICSSMLDEK